ncbi:LuxR C-terminal-related transcriptional regulator [Streptomyces sp. HK10]|uniref:helix-turn-helix transcriptional regulator n=1 Tax=Streptomyces sp. HK10 TaxID=3373255 RepID=UPI00374A9046
MARVQASWEVAEFAESTQASPAEIEEALEQLELLGLLVPSPASPSGYRVTAPEVALTRLFAAETAQATRYQRQAVRTREAITALLQDFRELRDIEREHVEIEFLQGPERVNAFLDDAIALIRETECVMHPGGVPPLELLDDMLLRDKEVISRRVRIRALYMRHVAEVDYMRDYLLDATTEGAEVRVTPVLPLRLMVFDGTTALTAIDPRDSTEGAIAVHGKDLVRSFQAIFDFCWFTADPIETLTAAHEPRSVELSPQQLVVARMLAEGVKDEVIARHLGVSVRTLSRVTAALMEHLNVSTRFQAGMKIVQLGLLNRSETASLNPVS